MLFYQKFIKRNIDFAFAAFLLLLLSPLFLTIAILIRIDSPGSIFFKQKRMGKNYQVFTLWKFRTMVKNAEELKKQYMALNEANGPVFKIKNDPRYTKFGKILSYTSLDELPQLVNILKGEMSFIGPRPFPIEEEKKIDSRYQTIRKSVFPGLTSPWVVAGAKHSNFQKWMQSDVQYSQSITFLKDLGIFLKTLGFVGKIILVKEKKKEL